MALLKSVPLTESKSLQFRFEGFNVFNHAQFYGPASVNGNINSSSFGEVVSAAASASDAGRREVHLLGTPVILSEVCASRMRSTNAVEGSLASMHGRDPIGASPPRPAAPSARKSFLRPSHPPTHRMAGGTIRGWPRFGGSIHTSYSCKIVFKFRSSGSRPRQLWCYMERLPNNATLQLRRNIWQAMELSKSLMQTSTRMF